MPAPPGPPPHPRALPRTWPAPGQLGLTQRGPWGLARSSLGEGLCSAEPKSWKGMPCCPQPGGWPLGPAIFTSSPAELRPAGQVLKQNPQDLPDPAKTLPPPPGRPLPGTERRPTTDREQPAELKAPRRPPEAPGESCNRELVPGLD
uniref:Uncharacterized protein n=1 Tax=Rangifer tarandus platyrhynchus TaxID=3082113 RepID=A0ACB0F3L0_RANTA|nr:unnamed protein product [Rangifer tarandus platyrhynchus]